jgi:hypothetical protein
LKERKNQGILNDDGAVRHMMYRQAEMMLFAALKNDVMFA